MDISISTLLGALLPILATATLFALLMSLVLIIGVGPRRKRGPRG